MARALELARHGLFSTDPNPRVGCVLLRDGEVVGEGWHERAGQAHAEPRALAAAGPRARGATAYVTLEPCNHHGRTPPCTEALIDAGVARVVYALRDPNPLVFGAGRERLERAGIRVEEGLCEAEARELNAGFVMRMSQGRPFVRLKLAMSLDGRTALANGESRWITREAARADVQQWRAASSAVLTGVGTVLADDPGLDVRLPDAPRQPWRVVLDSQLRTPPEARFIHRPGRSLLLCAQASAGRRQALEAAGALVEQVTPAAGRGATAQVDLPGALRQLARLSMNEVLVEAGATLAGALLAHGLVDELIVYMAPVLLGPDARPLVQLPALARLQDSARWRYTDLRSIGDDLRLTLRPV